MCFVHKKKSVLSILCTAFTMVVVAQEKVDSTAVKNEQLDEVVVTATRTVRQLSSLPLPVQAISKQEIQAMNAVRLSDLLAQQTGITTVPDFGGGEGIQMQGFDSEHVLILIDGMPLVGRSAGTLDLNRIAVANAEKVEIVKGASSSLYGSEALGGVVNIITKEPNNGVSSLVQYRAASFNTHDVNATVGYKKDKFSLEVFGNRFENGGYNLDEDGATSVTDGINTVEPFTNYTGQVKVGYQFSDKTNLKVLGRLFHQNQDYKASELLEGETTNKEYNSYFKLNHEFSTKWQANLETYVTQYKIDEYLDDVDTNERYSTDFFNQLFIRPEARLTYQPNAKHTLLLGTGYTYERLNRTNFSTTPENKAPYLYAQHEGQLTDKLSTIVGARFDMHNQYASQLSPKVALRYQFNTKLSAKASVGYGYKAPDFRQLYFNFSNSTVGYTVLGYNVVEEELAQLQENGEISRVVVDLEQFNAKLNPESSLNINLGIDYKFSNVWKAGINIFRNDINNLIDTRVVANKTNGQNVFSYYNVNKVFYEGVEFNTRYVPNKNLILSAGYQLLFAKDKAAIDAFENGEVYARNESGSSFALSKRQYFGLFNRSRHMANVKVFYTYQPWKIDANLRGTYRSKYGLYDSNGNNYLDTYDTFVAGYTLWDVAVNKKLGKHYTVSIGAENILDFTDTQNISNIQGRVLYGKLTFNL